MSFLEVQSLHVRFTQPTNTRAQSSSASHGGACADPFAPPEALNANGRNESERGAARRRDGRTSVARKARERGKTGFAHSVRQRREGRRDDGAVSGVANLVKVTSNVIANLTLFKSQSFLHRLLAY